MQIDENMLINSPSVSTALCILITVAISNIKIVDELLI